MAVLAPHFCAALWAQGTIGLTGPATARPGSTITVPVTLAGSAAAAALQWTLATPTGWNASRAIGAAGTAAGKQLACGPTGICLAWGLNQNIIAAGGVATYLLTVPAAAAPGPVALALADVLAASALGAPVPLTVGPAYSVMVLARSDLNGDGSTTILDVEAMLSQANGSASCSADQNGDGRCDLYDVQIVINAALGL